MTTQTAATAGVTITTEGRRCYVRSPYGHPSTAALKALGAKWDAESRRWWVGSTKRAAVEAAIARSATQPAAPEDISRCEVRAKGEYRGGTRYVIAESGDRCRIAPLDGSRSDWVAKADCRLIRTYEAREVWDGRYYSGRTITRRQTLGDLAAYAARCRDDRATLAAGKTPEGWCRDMEDGIVKPRHECDMPEAG